jgi:hypothetical protein
MRPHGRVGKFKPLVLGEIHAAGDRAALIAEMPWLEVYCAGCGTSHAIDLRKVDRHPLASVCQSAANVSPGAACNFSPPCVRWNARLMPVFSGAFLIRC